MRFTAGFAVELYDFECATDILQQQPYIFHHEILVQIAYLRFKCERYVTNIFFCNTKQLR
jgi:hypothetical protein